VSTPIVFWARCPVFLCGLLALASLSSLGCLPARESPESYSPVPTPGCTSDSDERCDVRVYPDAVATCDELIEQAQSLAGDVVLDDSCLPVDGECPEGCEFLYGYRYDCERECFEADLSWDLGCHEGSPVFEPDSLCFTSLLTGETIMTIGTPKFFNLDDRMRKYGWINPAGSICPARSGSRVRREPVALFSNEQSRATSG
jgi:hypothetical protein